MLLRPPSSASSRARILDAPKWFASWYASDSHGNMAADALIDTGAILAVLDKSDRWHVHCRDAIRQLRYPLLTTEAALAELFHMVGDSPSRKETTWQFLRSGIIMLASIQDSELHYIHTLMSRYADRPMDF